MYDEIRSRPVDLDEFARTARPPMNPCGGWANPGRLGQVALQGGI